MKNVINVLMLLICISANSFAQDVTVNTPDGAVVIYKGDLVTTSQMSAFYGLYDGISQCRLYIKLASGTTSGGLSQVQTSVDVTTQGNIIFPSVSLPPSTTANKHTLVMQCLGPVQDNKRQVTFSTDIVDFDIRPNVTTNLSVKMYLTQLTVKAVITSNYLTPGETYSVETVGTQVKEVTLDADQTAFTMTYKAGDQLKLISEQNGDSIGSIAYDSTFGNVFTEDLDLNVSDGNLSISAAFVTGDVIMSSPGLLVNNLPDSSVTTFYNFDIRGIAAGNYNVVLTVNGVEVEYDLNVTIGSGTTISATTGRNFVYSIPKSGDVLSLVIDFNSMYNDILDGTLNNPEVRISLVPGGDL